ncbi:hypothetical protein N431DRAFT_347475 [Stipitochalara longipes BDJ]|nr:hypothetical protein N431DRAFT_347475 [Stipitochalara longipes BDJ]
MLGFCIGQRFPTHLDPTCAKHISKYSPILDDVDISYRVQDFDGRFVKESIYRQVGGPEVDAAWEDLGVGYRSILLPASRREEAGLSSDHAHAREIYGGGYPVYVEGLHQLHCLNLVRQSLYYNYNYYLAQGKEAFGDTPEVLHWHVSHCVDFIRQRLMCTMDTDVFGSVWVGNRTSASLFVDFNTKHVCKNFDDIRSWAEKNQMPELGPEDFWEPPDENTRISRWAP